ncbi:VAN3-binding protein-like [Nymphaea colorata]|nr:VAN3-binding protein-like [Nymphaea colorata]
MERSRGGRRKLSSRRHLEGIEEDGPVKPCLFPTFPLPDTPREPMEFLSRSWSVSAMEVSKALSDALDSGSAGGKCYAASPRPSDADRSILPIPSPSDVAGEPFSDSEWLQLHRALYQDFLYRERLMNNGFYKSLLRGRAAGRWLKEQKEKRKEEHRARTARVHAATSVAGVAAAIAAIAAATAAVSSDGQEDPGKTTSAVASAAALVASHCVEIAESMGAHRDQILAVVDSAVNVRTSGDIMTLTAGAATALRGAAILRSRLQKGNGNASSSQSAKPKAEKESEGLETSTPMRYVSHGGDLLKITRKGEQLTWAHQKDRCKQLLSPLVFFPVSVYMNSSSQRGQSLAQSGTPQRQPKLLLLRRSFPSLSNYDLQVVVKLRGQAHGGTFVKKKKSIVYDVSEDIPAWPGREQEGGEQKAFFGIETARGLIQFEYKNKKHREIWSQGVQQLLLCKGNENVAASIYKERKLELEEMRVTI